MEGEGKENVSANYTVLLNGSSGMEWVMELYEGFLGKMSSLGKLLLFLSHSACVYLQNQSFFTSILYSTVNFSLGVHFIHFSDFVVCIGVLPTCVFLHHENA